MMIDRVLRAVGDELRASNAIAIVGAGASISAGYPLTKHLPPHVWKAVEAAPSVLGALAERLNRDMLTAKALIGDNEEALRLAYELVKADPMARGAFQHSFRILDAERTSVFSPAHNALAELLHRRFVETVVSLNWDTMLEAAYRRCYGRILRPDGRWLHKPHGDAADPSMPWVLPNEAGVVPDELLAQMNELAASRPRLLLIIGYSERDEVVVQHLIRPLEARWRVVRIGPNAQGDLAIPLTADEAIPALRDIVVASRAEVPGWEYVTFLHQNDLGAALDGRGLGPADVEACPKLPEVPAVVQALKTVHRVTINGDPGSGKSMVAYHAAHELCADGWEVVRLVDPLRQTVSLLAALDTLPVRTIAIVDDAQIVHPALLRGLRERARPDFAVLIVTNAPPSDDRGVVHISTERAVRSLAAALRARRDETLAVVNRFDPHVGDGWLDIRLEDRLDDAECSKFPWQFSFVLTAGERRARAHIATLRERNRADLLLAGVAARQIATRDAGASLQELEHFATTIGRDTAWVEHALIEIQRFRLLVEGERIRCPHQRYAAAALRIVCEDSRDPEWSRLMAMLRAVVLYGDPPFTGMATVLRELWFADGLHHGWREDTIVDDLAWEHITARCETAVTPAERGGAGRLLEALEGYHRSYQSWLSDHVEMIGHWITEATAESARGLSILMNALIQQHKEVANAIDQLHNKGRGERDKAPPRGSVLYQASWPRTRKLFSPATTPKQSS